MKDCEHDKIYSGAIKLSRRFPCICRKCGEQWDDITYEIQRVDLEQYHALRVLHGWAAPQRLPLPPRLPQIAAPETRGATTFFVLMLFFAVLSLACGLARFPLLAAWGITTVMPRWLALVTSGAALFMATTCYVGWRRP